MHFTERHKETRIKYLIAQLTQLNHYHVSRSRPTRRVHLLRTRLLITSLPSKEQTQQQQHLGYNLRISVEWTRCGAHSIILKDTDSNI